MPTQVALNLFSQDWVWKGWSLVHEGLKNRRTAKPLKKQHKRPKSLNENCSWSRVIGLRNPLSLEFWEQGKVSSCYEFQVSKFNPPLPSSVQKFYPTTQPSWHNWWIVLLCKLDFSLVLFCIMKMHFVLISFSVFLFSFFGGMDGHEGYSVSF